MNASDETDTLQRMQALWRTVLNLQSVGPDDNIFDLGADSVAVVRLVAAVAKEFEVSLAPRDIYASVTPRRVSSMLRVIVRARLRYSYMTRLPNGLAIRCPSAAGARAQFDTVFRQRHYMRHGIVLPARAGVLDLGAGIGMFSMFAALEAPLASIVSVEASIPQFEMLKFNLVDVSDNAVALNADGRVSVCSLSDTLQAAYEHLRGNGLAAVDLLRVDLNWAGAALLLGFKSNQWERIHQVVADVSDKDILGVCHTLESQGFRIRVDRSAPGAGAVSVYGVRVSYAEHT
ncbi:MAG TPA: phosphopantetheine-binding protein [Steroidobacteraceae bacterium]|nr:phosphopantetheine-binding protein [Steroidobacteraceae bacterium]